MLSWKIGAVTISRIVELENTFDPELLFMGKVNAEMLKAIRWLSPHYIDENGGLRMSFHALLVEAPGLKLVVDTCIGNDKPHGYTPHSRLSTPFMQLVNEAGFSREDVDVVICTHMHYDHVGWNTMLENGRFVPTFPNARYLFGRTEHEHWEKESGLDVMAQATVMADSIRPIFDAGLATLVEADHRVSNEVRLMPTHGHTPGHVSVVIESEGETAIITGDMIHHPCQVAHPDWMSAGDSDAARALETRARLVDRCAGAPVVLIGSHFPTPTAGRVHRDGDQFRFEGIASLT